MPKTTLLIVDDDPEITELVKDLFEQHDYRVLTANNGKAMQRVLATTAQVDLIILDIMMPGQSGTELCQKLRIDSAVPILILSAMADEGDRIIGLELGADDYLTKPFSSRELLARVRALLRRSQPQQQQPNFHTMGRVRFADWQLDRDQRCLIDSDDLATPLSASEYKLLSLFLAHPKRVLSRDQLMDHLHEKTLDAFDRSIDVLVGRLRKKIEIDPKAPQLILTVRGGGYQFHTEVST